LPSGLEYLIERVSVKFVVIEKTYVIKKQFPMCLSYKITVHKSQRLSLQNVINVSNSILRPNLCCIITSSIFRWIAFN